MGVTENVGEVTAAPCVTSYAALTPLRHIRYVTYIECATYATYATFVTYAARPPLLQVRCVTAFSGKIC